MGPHHRHRLICICTVPAAGSPAPPGGLDELHLAKECSSMTGQIGDHCTFTSSNIDAIPVGARAIYYGPVLGPAFISSSVLIDAGDGDTATGYCTVDISGTPLGMCSFVGGSGSLAGLPGRRDRHGRRGWVMVLGWDLPHRPVMPARGGEQSARDRWPARPVPRTRRRSPCRVRDDEVPLYISAFVDGVWAGEYGREMGRIVPSSAIGDVSVAIRCGRTGWTQPRSVTPSTARTMRASNGACTVAPHA